MLKKLFRQYSENKRVYWLILIGSLIWSLTMVKSGIVYSYGMGFWGPNGHDGIWHISLAKSLSGGTWEMPIFAGETIKNYHIGFDLILAVLHKITFIPVNTLYFQVLPPVLAILIGIYAYKFIYYWTRDKAKAYWGTFFIYFGGSLGWIITLIRNSEIGGESVFWSQQSISTLINPPFALSLVLIFAGLFFLIGGIQKRDMKKLTIATVFFGVLIQIKVYAGILILAGIFAAGLWNIMKRKGLGVIKVFSGSLILSLLLISPVTKGVENTLLFKPFWFLETMMSFPDRFGWLKFSEAMVNYKLGGVWLKAIMSYGSALLIFLVGNLGTRLIGFYWFWKKRRFIKDYKYIDVFVVVIILTGIIIPLFFVQRGTAWNTIQFMYYSLMFMGVLAGVSFVDLVRKLKYSRFQNKLIETLLIVLTIPTASGVLYHHYLPSRPPAKVSKAELEALNFLSKQPKGVVLTQPFDKNKADAAISNPPRPLYLYESTAYVSALSGKTTYLEDWMNLDITGYDWVLRREEIEEFFSEVDFKRSNQLIEVNKIEYLYVVKYLKKNDLEKVTDLNKIFENREVEIYRLNRGT